MDTDSKILSPHKSYKATVSVTGTKEELQELLTFIQASELLEHKDSKITSMFISELNESIQLLSDMGRLINK